jgi:hypothetical protein
MTAPDTVNLVGEFVDALPDHVRNQVMVTKAITQCVTSAHVNHGWTPQQLADWCTRDLKGAYNPAAILTTRLREAIVRRPPESYTQSGRDRQPLCGRCENGWLEDPDTHLPVARCPCQTGRTN